MTLISLYTSLPLSGADRIDNVRHGLYQVDRNLGLNQGQVIAAGDGGLLGKYSAVNRRIVSLHESLFQGYIPILQSISKTLQRKFCTLEAMNVWTDMDSTTKVLKLKLDFLDQNLNVYLLMVKELESKIAVYSSALYNLMARRDNKLNISVAAGSRRIASQSKRDSSAMETIAVLTVVFLPGTFVSAIFSTTIFDFRSTDSPVSDKFWIYWAVTIPLTILVLGIWTAWYYWNDQKQARQDRDLEKSINMPNGAEDEDGASDDGASGDDSVASIGHELGGGVVATTPPTGRVTVLPRLRRVALGRPDFVETRSKD